MQLVGIGDQDDIALRQRTSKRWGGRRSSQMGWEDLLHSDHYFRDGLRAVEEGQMIGEEVARGMWEEVLYHSLSIPGSSIVDQ